MQGICLKTMCAMPMRSYCYFEICKKYIEIETDEGMDLSRGRIMSPKVTQPSFKASGVIIQILENVGATTFDVTDIIIRILVNH